MSITNSSIKTIYNTLIKERYKDDYEFNRWFIHKRLRSDYYMTYLSLKHHLKDVNFSNCLEFGPGPGTWTRLLYKQCPESLFTLVDISEEMKNQFEKEMRRTDGVNYLVSDIMDVTTERKFDFFFSSRAIEYLEDKSALYQKLNNLLSDQASGMIITKNREYRKSRQGDNRSQHNQEKVTVSEHEQMLRDNGFSKVESYPVVIRTRILDRVNTNFSENKFLKVYKSVLTEKISNCSESVCIKFSR